jgi:hypothetical protein
MNYHLEGGKCAHIDRQGHLQVILSPSCNSLRRCPGHELHSWHPPSYCCPLRLPILKMVSLLVIHFPSIFGKFFRETLRPILHRRKIHRVGNVHPAQKHGAIRLSALVWARSSRTRRAASTVKGRPTSICLSSS